MTVTDLSPIGQNNRISGYLQHTAKPAGSLAQAGSARRGDSVELSQVAQYLAKLAQMPSVRQDVVDRVRADIAAGVYETPDKIDAAIDALLEDL